MTLPHFDWIAPLYRRIPYNNAARLKALAKLPQDGDLLDLAGGSGRVALALNGLVRRLVVLDESPGMLAQARQTPMLLPVRAQAEALPLPDGHFAVLLMVDAFHHLQDQSQALREMWRVLRPGGRIVIEEPDIRHYLIKGIALAEKVLLMRSHFRSPEWIAQALQSFSARVEIVRDGYSAWIVAEKPISGAEG